MNAITVKYLPATNTRGSRLKASVPSGKSVTVSVDHSVSQADAYRKAAEALCGKLNWSDKLKGALVGGDLAQGMVFVIDESKL